VAAAESVAGAAVPCHATESLLLGGAEDNSAGPCGGSFSSDHGVLSTDDLDLYNWHATQAAVLDGIVGS